MRDISESIGEDDYDTMYYKAEDSLWDTVDDLTDLFSKTFSEWYLGPEGSSTIMDIAREYADKLSNYDISVGTLEYELYEKLHDFVVDAYY